MKGERILERGRERGSGEWRVGRVDNSLKRESIVQRIQVEEMERERQRENERKLRIRKVREGKFEKTLRRGERERQKDEETKRKREKVEQRQR